MPHRRPPAPATAACLGCHAAPALLCLLLRSPASACPVDAHMPHHVRSHQVQNDYVLCSIIVAHGEKVCTRSANVNTFSVALGEGWLMSTSTVPSADSRLPAVCRGMPLHESLAGASSMGPAFARWPSSLVKRICTGASMLYFNVAAKEVSTCYMLCTNIWSCQKVGGCEGKSYST